MDDEATPEWNWSYEVAALKGEIARLKTDIEALRADLHEAELMERLEAESGL